MTLWVLQQLGGAERLEAATVRRLQRNADPDGARRLARGRPVITVSDLIFFPINFYLITSRDATCALSKG